MLSPVRKVPLRASGRHSGRLGSDRQRERERRALADLALHPDLAAMQLDELPREREAEAGALTPPGVVRARLTKLLEDQRLLVVRDADAGVRDRDRHGA